MKRATISLALLVASWALVVSTLLVHLAGRFDVRWYSYILAAATIGLLFPPLGHLIIRKHPSHLVGWLFVLLGAAGAVQVSIGQLAHWVGGDLGGALAVSSEFFRLTGFGAVGVLLLVYPTGRLLSKRWRIAVAACMFLTCAAISGVVRPLDVNEFAPLLNPLNAPDLRPAADFLETLSSVGMVGLIAGLVALFIRFRRGRSLERQQIKLFAFGAAASFVLIFGATIAFPGPMETGWLAYVVWNLPLVLIPAAAATAILRHGLYDIDRIVTRTLSYAIVTAFLGGVFVLVALVPAATVGAGDTPDWLIAVATLLVIAIFRPVRNRVQGTVDRRFNRARYDATQTIDAFTAHLREEVDLDALGTELRAVVAQTMQPTHVSLWVKDIP